MNALSAIIHPAPPGTQSAADTGAVGTPKATAAAPARTLGGAFDPAAIGPLIGDAAELGLDAVATPFQLAQSLTGALSAAALDLGAGQVQDAQQDFVSSLRVGFVEAQSRLNNDLSSIGAALARLTGTASTPAGQVGAPTSVVGSRTTLEEGKAVSPSATQSHPTDAGARPVVSLTQPTPSKPAATPLGGDHPHITAHNPGAVATTGATASTALSTNRQTPQASRCPNPPRRWQRSRHETGRTVDHGRRRSGEWHDHAEAHRSRPTTHQWAQAPQALTACVLRRAVVEVVPSGIHDGAPAAAVLLVPRTALETPP